MKFFSSVILLMLAVEASAENTEHKLQIYDDFHLSYDEVVILQSQHPDSDVKKLLKELENHESYRSSSYSDATRNPFQKKRYQFDLEDDK